MQRFDVGGKLAVVTGGAKGIGAATARLFRESGAKVVVLDIAEGCDVADEGQVKNAFAGVPVKLSARGAERIYEIELSAAEKEAFTKAVAANTELMNIARGFLS